MYSEYWAASKQQSKIPLGIFVEPPLAIKTGISVFHKGANPSTWTLVCVLKTSQRGSAKNVHHPLNSATLKKQAALLSWWRYVGRSSSSFSHSLTCIRSIKQQWAEVCGRFSSIHFPSSLHQMCRGWQSSLECSQGLSSPYIGWITTQAQVARCQH